MLQHLVGLSLLLTNFFFVFGNLEKEVENLVQVVPFKMLQLRQSELSDQ